MDIIHRGTKAMQVGTNVLDRSSALVDLTIRLWVANIFWKSALTKIATWDATLFLFEYEYAVPLLSTQVAAIAATAVEITMPVLLVIGLGTRFSAMTLFAFNIIAVVSYPTLHEVGFKDHQYWGLLLLVTIFHGPGTLSVDHFLRKRFWRK